MRHENALAEMGRLGAAGAGARLCVRRHPARGARDDPAEGDPHLPGMYRDRVTGDDGCHEE